MPDCGPRTRKRAKKKRAKKINNLNFPKKNGYGGRHGGEQALSGAGRIKSSVSIDGFCRAGGGNAVLGVSGSWRHLTPGNRVAGLGSRRAVRAARSALRTSGEEVFWGVEVAALVLKKTGVLALSPPPLTCVYLSGRGALGCWKGLGLFSLLCALARRSLKWASLQDRLGCSGAPLPAFSLAGLHHSRVVL